MKRCLIIGNKSDTIYLFLKPLISVLKDFEYEIFIICGEGKYFNQIMQLSSKTVLFEFKSFNRRYIYNLYKKIKFINPNLVIVNDPVAAFVGRIISRIAGIKRVVYYCHGLPFASHSNLFEKVIYFSLEIIASIFTTHNIAMNKYDYFILKTLNKNTYFNHGVGVDTAIIEKKIRLEECNNIKNIIFIGRLVRKKGIYEFIKIAKNKKGAKYKFYIYGDGSAKEKKKIAKLLIEENNIFFMGYKNNISEAFNDADIFLFPSRYIEGLPRVIMESMIYGIPVIASKIRGNKDIIKNAYNGYLFKFQKDYISNIYLIIENLCNNESKKEYIVNNAKKCIYEKYSISKIKSEYRYIIQNIENS